MWLLCISAFVAAVFYFFPVFCPFFSPGKRLAAGAAVFLW